MVREHIMKYYGSMMSGGRVHKRGGRVPKFKVKRRGERKRKGGTEVEKEGGSLKNLLRTQEVEKDVILQSQRCTKLINESLEQEINQDFYQAMIQSEDLLDIHQPKQEILEKLYESFKGIKNDQEVNYSSIFVENLRNQSEKKNIFNSKVEDINHQIFNKKHLPELQLYETEQYKPADIKLFQQKEVSEGDFGENHFSKKLSKCSSQQNLKDSSVNYLSNGNQGVKGVQEVLEDKLDQQRRTLRQEVPAIINVDNVENFTLGNCDFQKNEQDVYYSMNVESLKPKQEFISLQGTKEAEEKVTQNKLDILISKMLVRKANFIQERWLIHKGDTNTLNHIYFFWEIFQSENRSGKFWNFLKQKMNIRRKDYEKLMLGLTQ